MPIPVVRVLCLACLLCCTGCFHSRTTARSVAIPTETILEVNKRLSGEVVTFVYCDGEVTTYLDQRGRRQSVRTELICQVLSNEDRRRGAKRGFGWGTLPGVALATLGVVSLAQADSEDEAEAIVGGATVGIGIAVALIGGGIGALRGRNRHSTKVIYEGPFSRYLL